MAQETLDSRLSQLRRRALAVSALAALAWAGVAVVLAALAVVWLDLLWELSAEARSLSLVVAILAGAVVLAAGCGWAMRRGEFSKLARRLDQVGGTGGQIISGYDLSHVPARFGLESDLSRGLAAVAVDRASELAAGVSIEQAAPWQPARKAAVGLGVVLLATFALAVLAPAIAETQWLRFFDPFGDHPPYSRVAFAVEPGDCSVLYGKGLDIYVTATGLPVDQVELVVQPSAGTEEVLPMFREPSGRWRTVLSRVTQPGHYLVRSGRSRSRHYELEVITIPKLEGVRFRVTPPAYTRRPVYEGPLPENGLSGLPGAKVRLWAKSNRVLAGGKLVLAGDGTNDSIALRPTGTRSDEVSGEFEIHASGKFEISVTDEADHDSPDRLAGSITLLHDDKPFVRVMQPPLISLATPQATLPVSIQGEDDYGVSRLQLYRSLNESRALPLDVAVPSPPATRVDGGQVLPLSSYGLEPGDVIKLYARVEDNDPAGAKGSESELATVRIVSQQEFERMLRVRQSMEVLMSKYRTARRRMESMAEEAEGLKKRLKESQAKEMPQDLRDAIQRMAQHLNRESQEIRKSAEHLLPFDIDEKMAQRLKELAAALENEAGQMEKLADLEPEEAAKLLEEMLERLRGKKDDFEREAMEPLDQLESIYPLIEDQARFTALYLRQRELAERLASLKDRDGETSPQLKARMREFEEEQRRLRQDLNNLLDDIEQHAMRLSDEDERLAELRASALQFADAVRASDAGPSMQRAEEGLAALSGSAGHAGALKAADTLESFLKRGQQQIGEGAQACLKFSPQLSAGLGMTVDQLLNEAGLGMGGDGSGRNGYSTQRSSLQNIGLFGQLPGMDQLSGKGSQGPGDASGGSRFGQGRSGSPSTVTSDETVRAAGAAATAVPPRYRSRVGAYFERIAEDNASR